MLSFRESYTLEAQFPRTPSFSPPYRQLGE
jgi:hypothetical protein